MHVMQHNFKAFHGISFDGVVRRDWRRTTIWNIPGGPCFFKKKNERVGWAFLPSLTFTISNLIVVNSYHTKMSAILCVTVGFNRTKYLVALGETMATSPVRFHPHCDIGHQTHFFALKCRCLIYFNY